jgi:hypothetical protein
MQNNYDAFIAAHAANTQLAAATPEECIALYEHKLYTSYSNLVVVDLGAVRVYEELGQVVGWVDYENMCGFLQ